MTRDEKAQARVDQDAKREAVALEWVEKLLDLERAKLRELELLQEVRDLAAERDVAVEQCTLRMRERDAQREIVLEKSRQCQTISDMAKNAAAAHVAEVESWRASLLALSERLAVADTEREGYLARIWDLETETRNSRAHIARMEADAQTATERVERITWEARGAPMKGETP